VAGTGKKGFMGNGGPAKDAELSGPKGLAVGPDGNVYLADTESHSIRMLAPTNGTIQLIAGTGAPGDGQERYPRHQTDEHRNENTFHRFVVCHFCPRPAELGSLGR